VLSEEEKNYYNYLESALKDDLFPPLDKYLSDERIVKRGLYQCCNDWAVAVPQIARDRIREAKGRRPPPLFAEVHGHAVARWKSLAPLMMRVGRAGRRVCERVPEIQREASDEADALARVEGLQREFIAEIDDIDKRTRAVDATFRTLMTQDFEHINASIRGRMPFQQAGGLLARSSVTNPPNLSIHVSHQLYFIPVKISLNSDGDVELSSESAVPTMIGVFSIGAAVRVASRTRRLTIIHGDKKTVFSLSDKPFVYEVVRFTGDVRMSYDEAGNVTVELRGARKIAA
jgi:hypothetical protein